jgi:hypothetical protein
VKVLEDGWTAITVDGSISAHFEHTVAITKERPRYSAQKSRISVSYVAIDHGIRRL